MGRAAFIRNCRQLTAARFLRATTQAGAQVPPPVPATANLGQVTLRGSGTPLSAPSLNLALQAGGNITGYHTTGSGTPGATGRWKNSTDGTTDWRGYTDTPWLTYARMSSLADATTDYPGVSPIKELGNGSAGYVRTERTAGAPATANIKFCYRSTRLGTWTAVLIVTTGHAPETTSSPDFVVLPSGRLIAFYLATDYIAYAHYSDDNGLTWASWSSRTRVGALTAGGRQLTACVVDGQVCLIASMAAAGTTLTAYVGWSFDAGQTFTQVATPTWGAARACVSRTGTVVIAATDQSADRVKTALMLPGGAPGDLGPSTITYPYSKTDQTGVSPAIVCRDDGTIFIFGGGSGATGESSPAMAVDCVWSDDHGVTWRHIITGGTNSAVDASPVWHLGINIAAPYGLRQLSAGFWRGMVVVLGVTDAPTAIRDDSVVEMQFGGWEHLTEQYQSATQYAPYGSGGFIGALAGCYLPIDTPDNLGWTATLIAAGATVTLVADGLNIVSTAANNTYYTASSTYYMADNYLTGVRVKMGFYVASGGSVSVNRATIQIAIPDGAGNQTKIILRLSTDQIRMVDNAGTTLGSSSSVVNQFTAATEVLIALAQGTTATTGTVSAWYRLGSSELWVNFVAAATVTEIATATRIAIIGGTAAGASDWTLMYGPLIAPDEGGLSAGFTNPTNLAGRPIDPASDVFVTAGFRLGGAGGAGIAGDTWTWSATYQYSGDWLTRSASPSRRWQATDDGTSTEVAYDAGTTASLIGDTFGLVGTNFRKCALQMNATDSWGSPSFAITLDATVWQGTIGATKGAGYLAVDGYPWVPHRFQSLPGRRWFLETNSVVYEITDNDRSSLEVDGVDFSAISGTAYIFGDRMAAATVTTQRYRFARILISSLDTADGAYRAGTLILGNRNELSVPYANGYVIEQIDPSQVTTTDLGYRSASARAPWAQAWRIAWDPIDEPSSGALSGLMAFARGVRGAYEPFAFVRDLDDPNEIDIVRLFGPMSAENVIGNRVDQLARVAQVILRTEP